MGLGETIVTLPNSKRRPHIIQPSFLEKIVWASSIGSLAQCHICFQTQVQEDEVLLIGPQLRVRPFAFTISRNSVHAAKEKPWCSRIPSNLGSFDENYGGGGEREKFVSVHTYTLLSEHFGSIFCFKCWNADIEFHLYLECIFESLHVIVEQASCGLERLVPTQSLWETNLRNWNSHLYAKFQHSAHFSAAQGTSLYCWEFLIHNSILTTYDQTTVLILKLQLKKIIIIWSCFGEEYFSFLLFLLVCPRPSDFFQPGSYPLNAGTNDCTSSPQGLSKVSKYVGGCI